MPEKMFANIVPYPFLEDKREQIKDRSLWFRDNLENAMTVLDKILGKAALKAYSYEEDGIKLVEYT